MRLELHGGGLVSSSPRKPKAPTEGTVTVRRLWRLGDIIMCEPVCRLLSAGGERVLFSTRQEYYQVVSSFSAPPAGLMAHPISQGRVLDLDGVGVLHEGFPSKVDALLHAAEFDPYSLSEDQKRPTISVDARYQRWARGVISSRNIEEGFAVVVFSSHDAKSPRSLSRPKFEAVCSGLAEHCDVVVVGAKPVRLGGTNDHVHNLTGGTPDVMSLAGMFAMGSVVVSVDTGIMHLAGAAGVPLLSVLGPTRPEDVCPYYSRMTCLYADPGECSPCYDRGCDSPCLERLSPESIVREALARASHPDHPPSVVSGR